MMTYYCPDYANTIRAFHNKIRKLIDVINFFVFSLGIFHDAVLVFVFVWYRLLSSLLLISLQIRNNG
jgi:hypothetical protein